MLTAGKTVSLYPDGLCTQHYYLHHVLPCCIGMSSSTIRKPKEIEVNVSVVKGGQVVTRNKVISDATTIKVISDTTATSWDYMISIFKTLWPCLSQQDENIVFRIRVYWKNSKGKIVEIKSEAGCIKAIKEMQEKSTQSSPDSYHYYFILHKAFMTMMPLGFGLHIGYFGRVDERSGQFPPFQARKSKIVVYVSIPGNGFVYTLNKIISDTTKLVTLTEMLSIFRVVFPVMYLPDEKPYRVRVFWKNSNEKWVEIKTEADYNQAVIEMEKIPTPPPSDSYHYRFMLDKVYVSRFPSRFGSYRDIDAVNEQINIICSTLLRLQGENK